jgi:hypothetical protein
VEIRRLSLPGNRVLVIRPIEPSDRDGLQDLFAGLSEDDTYRRFFAARPPPPTFVEHMTTVGDRGGFGLVATIEGPATPPSIIAEASYSPLPNGDAELGITVESKMRGWIGPYLLDVLVEEGRANDVPNLEAEVLVSNPRMLALLESRGSAVLDREYCPATVRVCIGTAGRTPVWPKSDGESRLLIESPGGQWRAMEAARDAGFRVVACGGPGRRWSRCPLLRGSPCPLAAGADLIVDAVPGDEGRSLLEAHLRSHPVVPVCIDIRQMGEEVAGVPSIEADCDQPSVVALLQRFARSSDQDG